MGDESGDGNRDVSRQLNEEVSRDVTGEADGMNQWVDSRDVVIVVSGMQLTIA